MANYLKNKVIIITGAASGFGEILSRKAASMGAKVVGADVDEKGLQKLVATIRKSGGEISGIKTDVRDKSQMRA